MKNIINKELETLKITLHFLLTSKSLTDKSVVSCSQQLDEIIVRHYKATYSEVA